MPNGTEVKTADGEVLADLVGVGTRFVAAAGGRGGLGNAALASPRRKAPGFALKGEPGQQRDLILELKTVADVGLVGFPNAGKSSIIAAMSAARPKIANYPFTTLIPNLGVVEAGDVQFVVADVPGLIPGASQGKGLGHDFLRHVERCSILVHVLDCATEEPGRSPVADLAAIEHELAAYGEATGVDLVTRPRLIALNKIDVPAARERADQVKPDLEKRGYQVFEISAATGEGLRPLGFAMAALVAADRAARPAEQPAERVRVKVAVKNVDEPGFEVLRLGEDTFLIRGEKPRRWVQQTDFSNDEAVGYLADRLARLGVEEALAEAGAEAGAEVLIGEPDDAVVFDWDPAAPMSSGARARGGRTTARAAPIPGSLRDRQRTRRLETGHRGGDPGGGQGRLVLTDHRGRRDRRRPDHRPGRRPGRPPRRRDAGRTGLLRGDRVRPGPAGPDPAAERPGHPAGRGQRRPGPAHRPVHRGLRPARHPHRSGPAQRG